jgi:hypothetical protein
MEAFEGLVPPVVTAAAAILFNLLVKQPAEFVCL